MANYHCTIRSNYFRVKDEEKFRDIMRRVYGDTDKVHLWEETDEEGITRFGFGTEGGISGLRNSMEEEGEEYDAFIDALQECVAEDDAIIILEAGHESLRYISAYAEVITSKGCEVLNLSELAARKGAEALGNPNWKTRCSY